MTATYGEDGRVVARRSWTWRPLPWALAFLFLPQLAPLFAGPLTECSHCVSNFFSLFPCMPGMLLGGLALGADWPDGLAFAVAGLVTLAIVLLLVGTLQRHDRFRYALAWFIAILSGSNALAFASFLRA